MLIGNFLCSIRTRNDNSNLCIFALGYVLGGVFGHLLGWRGAFLICGLPGLVVAFSILKVQDPGMGANDDPAHHGPKAHHFNLLHDYKTIFSNLAFLSALAGTTANCFAVGGFADWFPTFLFR